MVHLGVENAAGPDRHWREQLQAPGREAREAGRATSPSRLMTDTVKEAKKITVPARERFTHKKGPRSEGGDDLDPGRSREVIQKLSRC